MTNRNYLETDNTCPWYSGSAYVVRDNTGVPFMRNKRGYLILLFLFICVNMCFYVSAAENEKDQSDILQEEIKNKILGEVDFSEINQNLKLLFPDEKICFQDIVETLMQGNLQETGIKILSYVKDQISYEFRANKTNLVHILFIAITAAVFTNFSNALQNKQVGEISFYILYMLLITMSLNSFRIAISGIEGKNGKYSGIYESTLSWVSFVGGVCGGKQQCIDVLQFYFGADLPGRDSGISLFASNHKFIHYDSGNELYAGRGGIVRIRRAGKKRNTVEPEKSDRYCNWSECCTGTSGTCDGYT